MDQKIQDVLGLGTWLGRKQAFGLLAGRCSAVDAECLRKLRDEKKYKSLGLTWEQFCHRHLGISRRAAEKIIKLLEEFGTQFFELSAVVRITPEEYRRIAPAVTSEGVQHNGRLLEIAMHNAPELSAAVQELSKEAAPPPLPAKTGTDDEIDRTLLEADRAVRSGLRTLREFEKIQLDPGQQLQVLRAVGRITDELKRFIDLEITAGKLFSAR